MNQGSAEPLVTRSLLARLREMAADTASTLFAVNILDRRPVREAETRTAAGTYEFLYPTVADGRMSVEVSAGNVLRFDERTTVRLRIEVLGVDSAATQESVDDRANEILFGVLRELALQTTWLPATTAELDYVWLTPGPYSHVSTRVEGRAGASCGISLGVEIRARRQHGL